MAAINDAALPIAALPVRAGPALAPTVRPPSTDAGNSSVAAPPKSYLRSLLSRGQRVAVEEPQDQFAMKREKFIPLTRYALIDRLAGPELWPAHDPRACRRFFHYLNFWRQNSYTSRLTDLEQTYEPFSPDSDLLITRKFSDAERAKMKRHLVDDVRHMLEQANYEAIDPKDIALIMTKESHYGLDLQVDMNAFEEILIYYRGASSRRHTRRNKKKFYLAKEEFDVPIFRRLFILFKLKPFDQRVTEVMKEENCERETAEKRVKKIRAMLPAQITDDLLYMKMFKNIPRSDIEMVFPNTRIRFRMFDKVKFGVTAGGGVGMGVLGTATKIAAATTPIGMAGAVAALGGIAVRQVSSFFNQRNKYMVTMAQNLYFHSLADNRGVLTLLADRAGEEDVKEELLLYSVLAKTRAHRSELPEIDHAIERWLKTTFGISANYDLDDALERLKRDGIVTDSLTARSRHCHRLRPPPALTIFGTATSTNCRACMPRAKNSMRIPTVTTMTKSPPHRPRVSAPDATDQGSTTGAGL